MSEAVILAIINAMMVAANNSAALVAMFSKLRAENRNPTQAEWAEFDRLDDEARATFQAVIDAMPVDAKPPVP